MGTCLHYHTYSLHNITNYRWCEWEQLGDLAVQLHANVTKKKDFNGLRELLKDAAEQAAVHNLSIACYCIAIHCFVHSFFICLLVDAS
jgi:hypothetical protein